MKRFINYLKGVKSEFGKIQWSTGKSVKKDFVVVIAFVIVMVAFFVASDLLISGAKDLLNV